MPINQELKVGERFLLNIIFPTASSLNLAIFLFLILAAVVSYAGPTLHYVQSPQFVPEFFGHDLQDTPITRALAPFAAAALIFPMLGAFGVAIVAMLAGKLDPGASVDPKERNKNMRGFSLLLYILSAFGAFLGTHSTNDLMFIVILYAVVIGLFGVILLGTYASEILDSREDLTPTPLREPEVLISVCVAGGAFIYYAYMQNVETLVAVCSAYIVFATIMGMYRAAVGVFSPTPGIIDN